MEGPHWNYKEESPKAKNSGEADLKIEGMRKMAGSAPTHNAITHRTNTPRV